jgi:hypothetical protein
MIPVLQRGSMTNWNMIHQMAMASLLMPPFRQVTTGFLGGYLSHSKPMKSSLEIAQNESRNSNYRDRSFLIVKRQSGECANYRGVLGGFEYPWGLMIWKRGLILLKVAFVFTTSAPDWLGSTR